MPEIVITGVNRGIGLEFARQYLEDGWKVAGTVRSKDKTPELRNLEKKHLGKFSVEIADATCDDQCEAFRDSVKEQFGSIQMVICNAAIYGDRSRQSFEDADDETMIETFRVNALGPLRIARLFAPLISRDGVLVNITSKMGSIEDNTSGGSYAYRTSKAALNMITRSLAHDLDESRIRCVVIHPGWVETRMGGPNALITTEESVSNMRRFIGDLSNEQTGQFFNYDGTPIPW